MNDFTTYTYSADEGGILVNAYLIETPDGVLLIDSGLRVSDAHAIAEKARNLRGPTVGVVVTHPHPDHFNGLPFVVSDDVPVYATAPVARTIAEIAEPKREQWQPMFGDEWPDRYRVPDHLIDDGGSVELAGLRITAHDLGPGESHADSYVVVESTDGSQRVAFIGDLAFGDVMHSYTADGHTGRWLDLLDRVETELAGLALYPGHGPVTDAAVFAGQRRYLNAFRQAITDIAAGRPSLTDDEKAELIGIMERQLPDAALPWLVGVGADAVASELAQEARSAAPSANEGRTE